MKRSRVPDLRVRDYMSREPVTIAPEETVAEALGRMRARDVHELPVLEDGHLVGLLTMWSLMRRRDVPPTTKVRTLMTNAPVVGTDDDLASVAEKLIETGFRALPVVEKKRLVGVVSRTDLARAIAGLEEFDAVSVGEVMTPNPIVVPQDETVAQAAKVIQSLGERSVPVVAADGRLVGVIGLKDMAHLFAESKSRAQTGDRAGEKERMRVLVKGIMKDAPITAPPGTTVRAAAELMLRHDVSSVIVPRDDRPVGILTKLDLVEGLARLKEREELLVQISGLEEQPDVYDDVYDRIRKGMRKVAQIVTPRTLAIHVQTYKAEGDRWKYSLRSRFATAHRMYYVNHYDWDLLAAVDGLMDQIERLVIKDKERRITEKRRHHLP